MSEHTSPTSPHAFSIGMITIDCVDPRSLSRFWSAATSAPVVVDHDGYFVMLGSTPALAFQKVEEPTPGKNRIHVDGGGGPRREQVERLVRLGAIERETHELDGYHWTVLEDPAGNAFCVGDPDFAG